LLRELAIRNFAVIEQARLDWEPGLNVLSGETGAGKTIVLSALGLLLGGRVFGDLIRHGEEEAVVEALFEPLPAPVARQLEEAGFGAGAELVIRRIVSRSGRNRVYVNGAACPVSLLAEIGGQLVHIYGQHEHHTLGRPETQLELLTAYGGLEERVAEMRRRHAALVEAWERLGAAREALGARRREEELLKEQLAELQRAALRPGEEEELRAEREVLLHAERLAQGCREGEELLYEADDAVVSRLGRYAVRLKELVRIDAELGEALRLIESSVAELGEATARLRRYRDRITFDPGALERAEERLAEIGRLKRKYGGSVEEILERRAALERELAAFERAEESLPELERRFAEAREAAWDWAEKLSRDRQAAAKRLKRELERELRSLGMAETVFEARFLDAGGGDDPPFVVGGRRLVATGADQVEFYFSPNPGEPPKPLAKIASGGELSRVMLALKSLVLGRAEIPTLLFDEVDAGIGGATAEIVGRKLKQVAERAQVICVTHLPQIAALADSHAAVRKEVAGGRTYTEVVKLRGGERVAELARMLGGVKITERTLRHAEELLRMHSSRRSGAV
jgi:DNA repair protein RecN (Recombination protein N)